MIGMSRTKLYDCLVVGIVGWFFICHALLVSHVSAKNTLAPGDELAREEDYLESPNKNFRLNFEVRPGSTSTTYTCFLCIQWTRYPVPANSEQTTVWVAWVGQTETSFIPKLTMEVEGRLVIHAENETVVNHNQQHPYVMNTTATLLDTGNLVLRGGGHTLWQSFDHPTANTWIPGMKIGRFGGLKTQQIQQRCLSSWTSEENPFPGDFTLCVDPNNTKQLVGMRGGSVYWHSGVWSSAETYFPFLVVRSHLRYFSNDNESYFAWDGTGMGTGTGMGMDFNVIKILANGEINVHLEGDIRSYINCDHNYTYYFNQGCVKTANQTHFPPLPHHPGDGPALTRSMSHHKRTTIIAALTVTLIVTLAVILVVWYMNPRKCCTCFIAPIVPSPQQLVGKDEELPFFPFKSIEMATNYFSHENKLGQGGFGPVYKGILVNGQEIAAKRLSKMSGHGIEQFKNEVLLISKLQHRNLVRLLGCCTQGDERILIYEYLQNKSLDSILFDARKKVCLDWEKRISIINGIAQGLLYLHKYSRLRIIHRDLKTSNILLDVHMHPKISDFGTARIFKDSDSRASTKSIIGTYGYMSPEYAMDGCFSEKSDVFSFGVMVMEIVSGKRNNGFYHPDRVSNLLGYAWDLWIGGRVSDLIDPTMEKTLSVIEATRYLQVGLLCVQDTATDRPTMSDVVSMLGNELLILPVPKQPGFSVIFGLKCDDGNNSKVCSINQVTITETEGR